MHSIQRNTAFFKQLFYQRKLLYKKIPINLKKEKNKTTFKKSLFNILTNNSFYSLQEFFYLKL